MSSDPYAMPSCFPRACGNPCFSVDQGLGVVVVCRGFQERLSPWGVSASVVDIATSIHDQTIGLDKVTVCSHGLPLRKDRVC